MSEARTLNAANLNERDFGALGRPGTLLCLSRDDLDSVGGRTRCATVLQRHFL